MNPLISINDSDDSTAPTILDLLPLCVKQLGPQGLASLASCSKDLKVACSAELRSNAASLLEAEMDAITARESSVDSSIRTREGRGQNSSLQDQYWQAVVWLLQAVPALAAAAADTAQRLISIPSVPPAYAVQLVAAGVGISCAQLLAAANSMVGKVEVWVQAQQQLGVQTDIPPAAVEVAVFAAKPWVSLVYTSA
jgi:hypothetical protein